jgi:hypothetical protein
MPKHKLTPEIEDALQQFADRLPVPEVKYREPVLGSQILADTPEMRGPKGAPIDPLKSYYVGSPTNATNHLRRLRKAFRKGGQPAQVVGGVGGQPAVVKYLQPYEAFLGTEQV